MATAVTQKGDFWVMAKKMVDKLKEKPTKYEDLEDKFSPDKSFEELFTNIWSMKEAHSMLVPELVVDEKSDSEAIKFRNEGNTWYRKRELTRALELYNLSIKKAVHPVLPVPPNPPTLPEYDDQVERTPILPSSYGGSDSKKHKVLAMAFGNRSAVLYEMKYYCKSLKDIDTALELGYPEEMAEKLEARRARCLEADATRRHEEETPLGIETSPTKDIAKRSTPTTFAQKLNERLTLSHVFLDDLPLPRIQNVNDKAPNLSSAVKVAHFPNKGRGLVATRDIATGEVIGVEKAVCVNIDKDELDSYCSYCLRHCFNPLPCPGCCKVGYCSIDCRNKSLTEEHWLECKLQPTMIKLGLQNRQMIYLLVKNCTFHKIKSLWNMAKGIRHDSPEKRGCDADGLYHSSSYNSIYHLCDNLEKQTFGVLFTHCRMAFTITKLLEKSGRFFIHRPGKKFSPTRDDLLTTGTILLSQALKVYYNPYEIMDLRLKKSIGGGIFPALSLFNHSCNPSTKHYCIGRSIVHRAVRPIKAGEELTDSYMSDFYDKPLEARRKFLENYLIKCDCEACRYEWPVYDNLNSVEFICVGCQVNSGGSLAVCDQCIERGLFPERDLGENRFVKERSERAWSTIFKTLKIGLWMNNKGYLPQKDFEYLCNSITLIRESVLPPCQIVCDASNVLLRAFELGS
ncbi:SET and MYND domain-containing protein 4-like [Macrobrachium rosenbergii]|uniref:SET and MYND domain-containing protein 4-like n=1 Tax=Macrobrachium rosenbergii TaxID=79674 RepID=UPI0034D4D858